jgi:hypothetical protein
VAQLSATATLALYEAGASTRGPERALALLAAAWPATAPADLAALPVGRRDALLLQLYAASFGARIDLLATCPACGETLDLGLDADALLAAAPADPPAPLTIEVSGYSLSCRLPDTRDLAALFAARPAPCDAPGLLLRRCVRATAGGQPVATEELPHHVVATLSEALEQADPLAAITLQVGCPACDHLWAPIFDIAQQLWAVLRQRAGALLGEVAALARAYGWAESAILAMSPLRRSWYLERIP